MTDMFKAFPEFSKLSLADRDELDLFIKSFPPISDISFPGLMLTWSHMNDMHVSELNGNLVIPYSLPGYEEHAGLSIIGISDIDESICTIFDYLRETNQPVQLVNVPEFVIGHIRYPQLFRFTAERGLDEYILPVSRLYPLEGANPLIRPRIKRFLQDASDLKIEVKQIDLSKAENRERLLHHIDHWRKKGSMNDIGRVEEAILENTVDMASSLSLKNACLFIDDVLVGYCIYFVPHDKKYAIICHFKFDGHIPRLYEFLAYKTVEHFAHAGIEFMNIEADKGIMRIRVNKMVLWPSNFFRKYKICPA